MFQDVPEEERAADSCPPQTFSPQDKKCDEAENYFHVLPFNGWIASHTLESQLGTAPPSIEASQQYGMSEVRVADRKAASLQAYTIKLGGPQDDHMLQQLVQAQVERTAQPSLNPEANAFVMRDANRIYGRHLRPDLDQD